MMHNVNKLKKIVVICVTAVTLIGVYIAYAFVQSPNLNEYISVGIRSVSVFPITDIGTHYSSYFSEFEWSKEIEKEIDSNPSDYVMADISYLVANRSTISELKDVRFYPRIAGDLNDMFRVCNYGNGTYYILAYANNKTGMAQHIVLKTNGKNCDDIKVMLMSQTVDMIYFTGGLMSNTGHGYKGIGKHKYSFVIRDAVEVYESSPEIFAFKH